MPRTMTRGEFSVWWWDVDGGQHEELRFVDAEKAMDRVVALAKGPSSHLGIVTRIIITDGGDCTCLEWRKLEGLVFPPPQK